MAYVRNPAWKDYPDTSTPINSAPLEHLEAGLENAASVADSALAGLANKAAKDSLAVNVKDHGAVGDGTADDTAALHAARDVAGIGGRVLVPAGTYVTSGLALNKASQTWELVDGAVIKGAASLTTDVVSISGYGVKFAGGKINGNKAAQSGADRCGIMVTASDVTIRNVNVDSCHGSGIVLASVSGCLVQGNFSHDHGHSANAAAGIYLNDSPSNRIVGNYCYGNGTYAMGGANDGDGIKIQSGSGTQSGSLNVVANNICRHNARRGVKLQQALAVVAGNVCEDNGIAGIAVTNSVAPDAGASGIISGNVLTANFRGLHIDNCADLAISGNLIISSVDYGILSNTSSLRLTVTGNVVRKSQRHGAYFAGLKDSTIAGNTFSSNGTNVVDRYGLLLADDTGAVKCERVLVSGNLSENAAADTSQTHGFVVTGTADKVHLVSNRAQNGLTVPFSIGGSTTNITRFGNVSSAIGEAGAQFTSFYMAPGSMIDTDTTTGFKIGSAADRKIAFYGATPLARQTLAAAATDAATTQTLANDIRSKLISLGLMS